MMKIFFSGLMIGISIAAPVGPIGVLCIRRTITEGRLSGLISGLGAASADAIYGIIAGFGLSFISSFLVAQQIWFRIFGGIFLIYLGIRTFITQPSGESSEIQHKGFLENYLSIFVLTLTNPMTILSFAAIFAGLGLAEGEGEYASATSMVFGVFSGSALWWLILSQGIGLFRDKVTSLWMYRINQFSGLIIIVFGVLALLSLPQWNSPL
jgi:threonine/homoserine/homoserine lactone efflux protein